MPRALNSSVAGEPGISLGWFDPTRPILPAPQDLIRRFLEARWATLLYLLFPPVLAAIATFRTFGFDDVRDLYPHEIADGWGIWYWFAQFHIQYDLYFFVINLVLAAEILLLAFPPQRKNLITPVSIVTFLYLIFWYLFGQARWGMALALLVPAAVVSSLPVLLLVGSVAFLIHKGIAGGVLLLVGWRMLKDRRFGLPIAIVGCAALSYAIHAISEKLLVLAGYANYLNWENLPDANTPYKFYYFLAILLFWKWKEGKAANHLLILTLLFLPVSYFIVFAGRSYVIYSVTVLAYFLARRTPAYVRYPFLALYVLDTGVLLFKSGFYF